MRILVRNRQSGKSHDIAKLMKKDRNAICIQPTEKHVRHFCKTYKFKTGRVMTMEQFEANPHHPKKNVYIDELAHCLQVFYRGHNLIYGVYTPQIEMIQYPGTYTGKNTTGNYNSGMLVASTDSSENRYVKNCNWIAKFWKWFFRQ